MYTSYIAYNSCEYKQSISNTKKIKFVAFKEENNTILSDEQINSEEIKTLSDEPKECSDTQIINTGQNITENPFEDEQTQKSEETINSNLRSTDDNNSVNQILPSKKSDLFKTFKYKDRGQPKSSKTLLKKKHKSSSFDNILTKIQVHFTNFLINLINDIVKTEFPTIKVFFRNIDYQVKKKIDYNYLSCTFQKAIKHIIITSLSTKYKKYESNFNQNLYNGLTEKSKWFKDFLEMKYINVFNLFYYNKEKALKTAYIKGKAITISPKTKSFSYLLKKNEGLAQVMKDTIKTVYLNEFNKENPFTTIKNDK